jgi:hypothetical protein
LRDLEKFNITVDVDGLDHVFGMVLDQARLYQRGAYDTSYLELAQRRTKSGVTLPPSAPPALGTETWDTNGGTSRPTPRSRPASAFAVAGGLLIPGEISPSVQQPVLGRKGISRQLSICSE